MASPQKWIPERYVRNASFVSELGAPVLALLAAKPGERVLDLGCGEGSLMRALQAQGVSVVGADSSPELIAAARSQGLEAHVLDGQDLPFTNEFDAVFSNAALHWMPDIARVFSGVARALRPQGRFVAECGGAGNVQRVRSALVAELERRGIDGEARVPWSFRSVEEYTRELSAAGFRVEHIVSFARPTPLPGAVSQWIETFGQSFTHALPEGERAQYLADVQARLSSVLVDAQGTWVLDYVRVRFVARLS